VSINFAPRNAGSKTAALTVNAVTYPNGGNAGQTSALLFGTGSTATP
jgi:hypothetical protein